MACSSLFYLFMFHTQMLTADFVHCYIVFPSICIACTVNIYSVLLAHYPTYRLCTFSAPITCALAGTLIAWSLIFSCTLAGGAALLRIECAGPRKRPRHKRLVDRQRHHCGRCRCTGRGTFIYTRTPDTLSWRETEGRHICTPAKSI